MTLPKDYSSPPSGPGGSGGGGKKAILWIGLVIIFLATILQAPLWIAWLGAVMVVIGIYYIFRERKQGKKKSLVITFGIVGIAILSLVIITTLSVRSAVEEQRVIDREVEAMIEQTSPHPDIDIAWYYDIEICRGELELGLRDLHEFGCDAPSIIERGNRECQLYNDEPLNCDPNSFLGREILAYLEVVSSS